MLRIKDFLSMSAPLRLLTITTIFTLWFACPSNQQTSSSCDPITESGCPANTALGTSVTTDFTSGESSDFTAEGAPTYGDEGVSLTITESGDAPTLVSNWYIMFGRYEITMKAAPGKGIVSSSVLLSDDLDEIDWEWLGAEDGQVQSNYFGKGVSTSTGRAAVLTVDGTQEDWHTYTLEWTEEQIIWAVDGTTLRVLEASAAVDGQYPQTPCRLKIGAWSGGDPSNAAGTIAWADGPTDYSDGPFTMIVANVTVIDYSTGTSYTYGNESGDWDSIESDGGKVNGNSGAAGSGIDTVAPAVTADASGNIIPWDGLHAASTSLTTTYSSYLGLPSGWSVNPTTGKVVPPSSGAVIVPTGVVYMMAGLSAWILFMGVWL